MQKRSRSEYVELRFENLFFAQKEIILPKRPSKSSKKPNPDSTVPK